MRAIKAVKQKYQPSQEILCLLEQFRLMVNECVRIGLEENVSSLGTLSKKAYHQLSRYKTLSYYRYTAMSNATGLLSAYRKSLKKHLETKKPHVTKLMLMDCYGFKIIDGQLRLSLGNRRFTYIGLNNYVLRSIRGYTVRSVCLTARNLSIAFSKETVLIDPAGLIGIDRNLSNITSANSKGEIKVYDLSKAVEIKETYRNVKCHFKRNDVRVRKRIYGKYGRKQKYRVHQILHRASKKVVEEAKANSFGIVLENLKGIRKLYRKGNGQGKRYRGRMNNWGFYEFQRQVEYKALWEGIPVYYVHPHGTSSVCAICGSKILECINRKVYCLKCDKTVDRDINAAKNILARGALRFGANGLVSEAMNQLKDGKSIQVSQVNQPKT